MLCLRQGLGFWGSVEVEYVCTDSVEVGHVCGARDSKWVACAEVEYVCGARDSKKVEGLGFRACAAHVTLNWLRIG